MTLLCKVDFAINHDPVAIAVHAANHPKTKHYATDIWETKPKNVTKGRHVAFLWASPDCTHFSVAKGGKPRKQNIRSLAYVVVEWARDVQPDIIMVENVAEFLGWSPLDASGMPIKARMGETFRVWKARLELLGYQVDHRVLDASLYGAPTKRRRLFLIARRDGKPIVWPESTHGPGKLPLHTAAECIDWSLPCPSIFDRKKPLAEKTLWRIAQGIKKFVLENPTPFIVGAGGRARQTAPTSADQPVGTVTAKNDRGVVVPVIAKLKGDAHSSGVGDPVPTITAQGPGLGVIAPVLATIDHRGTDATAYEAADPLKTTTTKNRHVVIAPSLVKVNHGKREARGESLEQPLSTVTATQRGHAVIAPVLVNTRNGERATQAARVFDVREPARTVTAKGSQGALVTAFLNKHYGGNAKPGDVCRDVREPISTITATDHHSVTAATLVKMRGDNHGADPAEPMPTVSAQGNHVAEVRAFLVKYFNTGHGQRLDEPAHTITTRHRLGLVTVEGVDYQIVDIGFRMLEPHELLRAQFGRFAEGYDMSAAKTKRDKVRLIGNSVCPEMVEALVLANMPGPGVVGDLFAGGGGTSAGLEAAINHGRKRRRAA
jgi:DNA (cytosine-5)-methyltransferase 1